MSHHFQSNKIEFVSAEKPKRAIITIPVWTSRRRLVYLAELCAIGIWIRKKYDANYTVTASKNPRPVEETVGTSVSDSINRSTIKATNNFNYI